MAEEHCRDTQQEDTGGCSQTVVAVVAPVQLVEASVHMLETVAVNKDTPR